MVMRTRPCLAAILFAMVLFSWPVAQAAGKSRPVLVVVNASVPDENISLAALRDIVLGQRRFWSTGERVELVVEAGPTRARRAFVTTLSGMTESQFQHYWTSLIFSHRATRPPRAAPDRRLLLALVNAIPGALALVDEGELPENTKVLRIDNLSPGDPGYPL
jgi:hypothetical protein